MKKVFIKSPNKGKKEKIKIKNEIHERQHHSKKPGRIQQPVSPKFLGNGKQKGKKGKNKGGRKGCKLG